MWLGVAVNTRPDVPRTWCGSLLNLNRFVFFSGLQFSYIDADGMTVPVVQLTFLKLLSATGRQTFTYVCQNSAGWYDSVSRGYQQALRFRAGNDEEMTQTKTPFIMPLYDGCQVCVTFTTTVAEVSD